jgi:hypothetical protein
VAGWVSHPRDSCTFHKAHKRRHGELLLEGQIGVLSNIWGSAHLRADIYSRPTHHTVLRGLRQTAYPLGPHAYHVMAELIKSTLCEPDREPSFGRCSDDVGARGYPSGPEIGPDLDRRPDTWVQSGSIIPSRVLATRDGSIHDP